MQEQSSGLRKGKQIRPVGRDLWTLHQMFQPISTNMSDPVGRFYYNFFGFIRCLLQDRERAVQLTMHDYAEVQGQWWVYLSCLCQWANTSTFSPHVYLPAPKHIMECGFHVFWERDSRERHHPWLEKEADCLADLWHCFNKKSQHRCCIAH